MPMCTSPLQGFRAPGGQVTLNRNQGWSDRPVTVNCGGCMACRIKHSQHWAIRCVHEAQLHEQNSFVTLTYDQAHVPNDGSLDVSHWQKFAKRLRKQKGPFRFLHCGEYGEQNYRPHYHACIFGIDFNEDRKPAESTTNPSKHPMWVSPTLDKIWGHGFATIGTLNKSTANYTAQYILKKQKGKSESYTRINSETGEVYAVKPPYITMSRRPGLGAGWLDKYLDDVYPDDFIVHENKKCSVPKFYNSKLEKEDPVRYREILGKRNRKGSLFAKQHGTPQARYDRAYTLDQQTRNSTRNL